jgi:hypothetical protein
MASSPSSILVLGAGELGTAVLTCLAKHPSLKPETEITLLIRQSTISTNNPAKRQELEQLKDLGIQFIAGDINKDSEATLASRFAGFEVIISCSGMYNPPGTQLKLTRAVLSACVQQYIPWQFGVDYDVIGRNSSQDLFTEQMKVRDLLRGQAETSWIVVSTGMFMSFLFEDFFGVVSADRRTVRALGNWNNAVTVTDVEDSGRVVSEIVLVETEIRCQVVYTAGDTISYGTLADVVEGVEGKEIVKELWTVEKLKDDLSRDPEHGIKKYRVVFAEGRGVCWPLQQALNQRKNIKLQNVRDWLLNRKKEEMASIGGT